MNFIKRVDNAKEGESWLVDRIRFRSHIIGPNAATLNACRVVAVQVLVQNEHSVTELLQDTYYYTSKLTYLYKRAVTQKKLQRAHLLGIALLECARRCIARSNRCRCCMRVARHCSGEQSSSANVA